jgi:ATP sulfurylase
VNHEIACSSQFRKMLLAGEEIPEWFAFRSVVKVLRHACRCLRSWRSIG